MSVDSLLDDKIVKMSEGQSSDKVPQGGRLF